MNPSDPNTKDVWLPAKVSGFMTAIGSIVLVGGLLGSTFYLLPALGIDAASGASFGTQPLLALGILVAALLSILLFGYAGAIVAAALAVRLFPVESVRKEFLWFMWLPGLRSANLRLFDRLFGP